MDESPPTVLSLVQRSSGHLRNAYLCVKLLPWGEQDDHQYNAGGLLYIPF